MNVLESGAIERVVAVFGAPLLEFLCSASIDDIASNPQATALVAEIDRTLHSQVEGEENLPGMAAFLRARIGEVVDGEVLGYTLYRQAGGDADLPKQKDPIEDLIMRLAAQCLPLLLLPPDDFEKTLPFPRISWNVTSTIFRHSLNTEFQAAVRADAKLAKVFSHHSETSGHSTGMIYRSTGQGSGLQLWGLFEHILSGAWLNGTDQENVPTPAQLGTEAIKRWRTIRSLLTSNKQHSVPAKQGFTGALLPGSGPYDFGVVTLRATTASDREHLPEHLVGQLSGTDADGNTVSVDYSGDIVAETMVPISARIVDDGLDDLTKPFPVAPTSVETATARFNRLRISLMLAVKRQHRVQVQPTWQYMDDPISQGRPLAWNDPRSSVGLMPTQLSETDMDAWREWYTLLATPGNEKISIAISRVIRATGERRDPIDVLIDSVIAWENLFGSSEGEPTLRVTASIAILIEEDPQKRPALRTDLAKIYRLRSQVVHGNKLPKQEEISLCFDALDFAIEVLKAIFSKRPDLLQLKDGTERSHALLLQQGPKTLGDASDEPPAERKTGKPGLNTEHQ